MTSQHCSPATPTATTHGAEDEPLDILCVGIGPFGLGLACLADPLDNLSVAFLDRAPEFNWHPGLLFDRATLQVPFLADLVTMADPTSRFSFLAWLKETGKLYPFYVRESFYPLRREYNDYCRWAAHNVRGLHWGQNVVAVTRSATGDPWRVTSDGPDGPTTWWTRHLVIGTGTSATVPPQLDGVGRAAVHAGEYLTHRERLAAENHVTVVGSGQSAAEVVLDLLNTEDGPAVDWITRSPRFFPMEYSKLSLELTSPEYLDHFRALPEQTRDRVNACQPQLHRGISDETISELHEALYVRRNSGSHAPVRLLAATELTRSQSHDGRVLLSWRNTENGHERETITDAVVAGTGYAPSSLPWLEEARDQLFLDSAGRISPDRYHRASADGTVHVLNHGEHTHALTAPDLGMGPLRNAHILNRIVGSKQYRTEERTTFQSFGRLPQARPVPCLDGAPGAVGNGDDIRFTTECQGRRFEFRHVAVDRDLPVLHDWLSQPRAAAWHLVDASQQAVATEYRRMAEAPSETAWLVHENGHPLALVETYDPACSPLTEVFPVRDGDAGLHLFLAPTSEPVSGTTGAVMAAALDLLWADPVVQRVLVEPDVHNHAVRAVNRKAGFRELEHVVLPDKTACLSVLERPLASQNSWRDVGGANTTRWEPAEQRPAVLDSSI
ncbi:siderophore biosynthesis protein [Kocuria sp. WRN011]|uniref:GNAT family N-acetyltransferase n=1 Tax=Kocuria sp. WRN011 TaxID=2029858 RepID=UPI000BAF9835|nr:GNAT family N-acetyltransferase [Kocuria sp. WRN011]PBB07930.1 siderophore biosynthesis protein [Kocuria sp. WRN011]